MEFLAGFTRELELYAAIPVSESARVRWSADCSGRPHGAPCAGGSVTAKLLQAALPWLLMILGTAVVGGCYLAIRYGCRAPKSRVKSRAPDARPESSRIL